jgi:hypothetical protein
MGIRGGKGWVHRQPGNSRHNQTSPSSTLHGKTGSVSKPGLYIMNTIGTNRPCVSSARGRRIRMGYARNGWV